MMNNDKGRGGTGPRKEGVNVPRYCISPQLAPPVLSPAAKKMFARSEDYHSLGNKTGRK